jgi:hypothetical protein
MRKLSKMICLSAAVLAPILAAGCSDDENSDNPGSGATTSEAGESGGGTKTTGGTKGNGGSAGKNNPTAGTGGTKTDAGEGPVVNGGADPGVGGGGAGNVPVSCDLDALEDGGAIPVDGDGDISEDTTLETGKSYTLDAVTRVLDGATLTIEPCVKILGTAPTAVLGVMPGGKLEAAGEADAPIVFTSSKAAGERLPGDWGGLIILGNARVNQTTPSIEGLEAATPYGAATNAKDTESSGTLQYVRVEFVGRDIDGKGNESNGITFGGVGSGTTVDHVMVSNSIDDCFEFFGGAVNADHLIGLNCDDDIFDADFGFSGHVQFAFGKQFESSTEKDSNGFEMDTADNASIDPRTTAKWSNVTLCGANTGTAPALPRIGAVLRRQVSGSITNAIITGFDSGAFSIRNTDATPPTDIAFTSSLIFDNLSVYHAATHTGAADWFETQTGNVDGAATIPAGFDCYSDPPAPIPDADIAGVDPGAGFVKAQYKGAFKAGENWMTGKWVDWSAE